MASDYEGGEAFNDQTAGGLRLGALDDCSRTHLALSPRSQIETMLLLLLLASAPSTEAHMSIFTKVRLLIARSFRNALSLAHTALLSGHVRLQRVHGMFWRSRVWLSRGSSRTELGAGSLVVYVCARALESIDAAELMLYTHQFVAHSIVLLYRILRMQLYYQQEGHGILRSRVTRCEADGSGMVVLARC